MQGTTFSPHVLSSLFPRESLSLVLRHFASVAFFTIRFAASFSLSRLLLNILAPSPLSRPSRFPSLHPDIIKLPWNEAHSRKSRAIPRQRNASYSNFLLLPPSLRFFWARIPSGIGLRYSCYLSLLPQMDCDEGIASTVILIKLWDDRCIIWW